ncbi:uncharacterized protein LOC124137038 [Haliotis rufescens]|uniref:uncharacterized protein LOC124137038 n=1 Tax=Haliotis rufescens TaxID=6454 RepID=UPI00201E830B|nr:uncharacterized protein LOC124137038 [Haliotis rufescens]
MDIHTAGLFLLCIYVVTGERSFWVNTNESTAHELYKTETPLSWWDAANHGCAKSDGHLFVPQSESLGDRVKNLIDENKEYWVGGFQYSYLKWTGDNTRYHTRVGYLSAVFVTLVTPVTLRHNSASSCGSKCGTNHRLYGLKGTSCYCLGNSWISGIAVGHRTTEIQCPGNYDRCGDHLVMTVYRKDDYRRYHTRVGYMYAGVLTPVTLQDNSAFSCDLRCGNNHRLYGLKGTSCYCLGLYSRSYNITVSHSATDIRCPGDYNERCGNDIVMTVYKKGDIYVPLSTNGACGYVERYWDYNWRQWYPTYHLDNNCGHKRPYACADKGCDGKPCVRTPAKTWEAAQKDCRLAKPTISSNWYNLYQISDRQCWIGLYRSIEGKFINGKTIENNVNMYYSDQRCLGVLRTGNSLHFNWYDCHLSYPAICNPVKRESTPLIWGYTSAIHSSTQVVGASTKMTQATQPSLSVFLTSPMEPPATTQKDLLPTDSSESSVERTTSHPVDSFVNQGTDSVEDHPSGFTVMHIVGAASVLAVGIVIALVLVLLKRQRRYCFKIEDEREDGVHYDRARENLSYSLCGPVSQGATSEDAHVCPVQTESTSPRSTRMSRVPIQNRVSNNGFKQEESFYNVPDEKSPGQPTQIGQIIQINDTAASPQNKGFEDDGQYNVLHGGGLASDSKSGLYAHIGPSGGEVEYDTTRHAQNIGRFDDTYNHIGLSKKPDVDDEDQYNVLSLKSPNWAANASTGVYDHTTPTADQRSMASTVQGQSQHVSDDIYSHIDRASRGPKKEEHDVNTEGKEGNGDDAQNLNGKADVGCCSADVSDGAGTEHVYGNTGEIIGPYNKAPCVEDEANYYNIDSIRESKLDETLTGGEGDTVYSLARGISDK